MKKTILLLSVMLLSGITANAVNWQPVNTNSPNLEMYFDIDSLRWASDNEYLYAIRYKSGDESEKLAYIKTNRDTNYSGIIYINDFDLVKYQPNYVFDNPHVFMKPVKESSILRYSNQYVAAIADDKTLVYNYGGDEVSAVGRAVLREDIPIAHKIDSTVTNEAVQAYIAKISKLLQQNWVPPKTGYGSRMIVDVTIGHDGSLLKYKVTESSGDEETDRSIVSALERTVPYPKLPGLASNIYSMDFRFVFDHDRFTKSVIY